MAVPPDRPRRIAVLIDAENASPRVVPQLFEVVGTVGTAGVRRVYGDFSGTRLKGWTEIMSRHALRPCQTPPHTSGKNGADIALVIDAVDLLHTGRIDVFCIVSSDSDFTGLALRIREEGATVLGFGEGKTPESFRQACDRFVQTDELQLPEQTPLPRTDAIRSPVIAAPLIQLALADLGDGDGGWHFLGAVGQRLSNMAPGFAAKHYGCTNLVTLIERTEAFAVRRTGLRVDIRPK